MIRFLDSENRVQYWIRCLIYFPIYVWERSTGRTKHWDAIHDCGYDEIAASALKVDGGTSYIPLLVLLHQVTVIIYEIYGIGGRKKMLSIDMMTLDKNKLTSIRRILAAAFLVIIDRREDMQKLGTLARSVFGITRMDEELLPVFKPSERPDLGRLSGSVWDAICRISGEDRPRADESLQFLFSFPPAILRAVQAIQRAQSQRA